MNYPRSTFNLAGCPAFSVELPPGLIFAELSDVDPAPKPFTFAQRFAAIVAVNGPASIIFSSLFAQDVHFLTEVMQRCAKECGCDNPALFLEQAGGEQQRHPGLLAEVATGSELAVVEDGGEVIIMAATGEADIWPDCGPFLRRAMLSVELLAPRGPTLPLAPNQKVPKLQPGVPDPDKVAAASRKTELERKSQAAAEHIAQGRFDEAEALLIDRDAGPGKHARMGCLYEERLRESDNADKNSRETLYRRALDWKLRSYPEPHTAVEAENVSRGRAEDRATLITLLGYDPDKK